MGAVYTDVRMASSRHFTFLPEILPRVIARLPTPINHLLASRRLAVYSPHDMAVLRKPA